MRNKHDFDGGGNTRTILDTFLDHFPQSYRLEINSPILQFCDANRGCSIITFMIISQPVDISAGSRRLIIDLIRVRLPADWE